MRTIGCFPFGQPVQKVIQNDRTPKQVFVLGVYASAVHAQWVNANGKTLIKALAVASEPCIFWRGEHAEEIINNISIPPHAGKLLPAEKKFNGPSGIALDEKFLNPLGLERKDAWLCDLVPHSCVNPKQKEALLRAYDPVKAQFHLPEYSVPGLPSQLTDDERRKSILAELRESDAGVLVLLGDLPIRWFLKAYDGRWSRLSDFGMDAASYGRLHDVNLDGKALKVLPLCHPRQSARLGASSNAWYQYHSDWIVQYVKDVGKMI